MFTIGLTALGHPELIIAGLDASTSQSLLNTLATRLFDRAQRFTAGQRISDLLDGYDVIIVEGPPTDDLHPGAAIARYGLDRVRLQQVVWPDKQAHFPWDPEYALDHFAQPVLGQAAARPPATAAPLAAPAAASPLHAACPSFRPRGGAAGPRDTRPEKEHRYDTTKPPARPRPCQAAHKPAETRRRRG